MSALPLKADMRGAKLMSAKGQKRTWGPHYSSRRICNEHINRFGEREVDGV